MAGCNMSGVWEILVPPSIGVEFGVLPVILNVSEYLGNQAATVEWAEFVGIQSRGSAPSTCAKQKEALLVLVISFKGSPENYELGWLYIKMQLIISNS